MGMFVAWKCPTCWEREENCTCGNDPDKEVEIRDTVDLRRKVDILNKKIKDLEEQLKEGKEV